MLSIQLARKNQEARKCSVPVASLVIEAKLVCETQCLVNVLPCAIMYWHAAKVFELVREISENGI